MFINLVNHIFNDHNEHHYFMGNTTTITIARTTKEKIAQLGKKNDTYDDILNRLLVTPSVQ
jgi:hypothetical protein